MVGGARVYVVDDDAGARDSMRWLLESEGLAVEAFSSAGEFLAARRAQHPSCLVLDLRMPEMDGLALQSRLQERGESPPIIFVTGHGTVPKCVRAMKAGAVDFLEKPVDDDLLVSMIRKALDHDRREAVLRTQARGLKILVERLTPREQLVLRLLCQGKAVKAAANELGVSFQTLSKHRARALAKLGVENEVELLRLLGDRGLELASPVAANSSDASPGGCQGSTLP